MEFVRGFHNVRPAPRGCVATLGNLDGVHLGHQALLLAAKQKAMVLGLPTTVVTFEPLPREYFAHIKHEIAPARLTPLRDKVDCLAQQGIDRLICLHFNKTLRSFSATQFVEKVLVERLAIKFLVIGDDFRFGCDRLGDFDLLKRMGQQYDFEVNSLPTLLQGEERISSSHIRQLLAQNNLVLAEQLLGRPYSLSGRVIRGNQIGRQLGVPTANIHIGSYTLPLKGVYAVTVMGLDKMYQGVANIGIRPTLTGQKKPILEVNLFDFNRDIYGQIVKVVFCKALRQEQKFESLEILKAQIQLDIKAAKAYFA
jgi:riboflavin kinase/FMN adenylyltransferase